MSAILKVLPLPRGRRALSEGSDYLRLFPRFGPRTYIYAIAFKGGVVKVGKTTKPRSRLRAHWKSGGGEVEWVHLFASMHERTASAVERAAPKALKSCARQINGSEWFFSSEDKAEIIRLVRECIDSTRAAMQLGFDTDAKSQQLVAHARATLQAAGISDVCVSAQYKPAATATWAA